MGKMVAQVHAEKKERMDLTGRQGNPGKQVTRVKAVIGAAKVSLALRDRLEIPERPDPKAR